MSKIMLDFISIFSKGGILLWCFKGAGLLDKEWEAFTPTVNQLIKTVLLQERTSKSNYWENGQLALKYKLDNEFELVFVVAYQKMLPLLFLDRLLDELQIRFRDMFNDSLKENLLSLDFSSFDSEYSKAVKLVEAEARLEEEKKKLPKSYDQTDKAKKTIGSMIKSDKNETIQLSKKAEKKAAKAAAAAAGNNNDVASPQQQAPPSPNVNGHSDGGYGDDGDELDEETIRNNRQKLFSGGKKSSKTSNAKSPKPGKTGKTGTTWDPIMFGGKVSSTEAKSLDRTKDRPEDEVVNVDIADRRLVGTAAVIQDLQEDDIMESSDRAKKDGGMFSIFKGLVGSKVLTKEDLEPVIGKLKDNLIDKNVAAEVANKLCESVAMKLEGSVCGTFQSVQSTVKETMTESLLKLLTPKRRIDIIRDVMEAKANNRPYIMTFCGVNGVGKSTNLAKICFWLIENKFRVLIAACDTFRAGAVEQLRTHTKRLNSLHPPSANGGKEMVQLYEKGYDKDAAGIAMQAINFARDMKIDVVLVDTAGRMQDNEPLMRSLAKLISVNAPDLVLFVGEALVGNEAIDQLVKFNAALADHSQQENPHTIDGIVLTKFDTIDDKVGSAISMTYISGQPIVFVGTGQTYADLKSLNAKAVVSMLMK
eukprot:TRINITY_DN3287_c0_g1_i1.p1 TRINITY_DN3287_c0_g1~~TRINITY_DN3287_c0_g1_i1.p1  ORF type:complete len:647 (-),score=238.60 TRINITY_DN3287_c0_g1_i1:552-2492(-)